jgi:hypothetical protein
VVVQLIQDGLKLNGTQQLPVNVEDVSILGGSIYNVQENAEALTVVSKETGLEGNADKSKNIFMPRDQIAGKITV